MEDKTMKTKKQRQDEFIASLMPDSDKRMVRIASASLLVALSLGFWASTYEQIIDNVIFDTVSPTEIGVKITMDTPKEVKKPEQKPKVRPKPNTMPKPGRREYGGGGKPKGPGNPKAPTSIGLLKILESRTNDASHDAFAALGKNFKSDLEKLDQINILTRSGKPKIGAERRGPVNSEFNPGVAAGGSGGISNKFGDLLGTSGGPLATSGLKGHISTPKPNEIDMGSAGSSRSASEIMKIVRQRTPGLRHIYNKHLKKNPGFQGKVTLRFTIAPGGEIISISLVSSTTKYNVFDNEIRDAVRRWTFSKVKSGNTTVTIPFTFTE